jgi:hypothetical protein
MTRKSVQQNQNPAVDGDSNNNLYQHTKNGLDGMNITSSER